MNSVDRLIKEDDEPVVVHTGTQKLSFRIHDSRDYVQRNILYVGYFEWRETRLLRRTLKPGQVFVDVGANVGWFSVLARQIVGVRGRVIAFEPEPQIATWLRSNLSLNGYNDVEVVEMALADRASTVIVSPGSATNRGTASITLSNSVGTSVPATTFDAYAADASISRIHFMKIDVEGAEPLVLRGMTQHLRSGAILNILIEVADELLERSGSSAREVLGELKQSGYRLFTFGRLGQLVPAAPRDVLHHPNIFATLE